MKKKPQTQRKYLQHINLTKDLYPEYIIHILKMYNKSIKNIGQRSEQKIYK